MPVGKRRRGAAFLLLGVVGGGLALKTDTATVVALATPEGEGGLAVVRLSGHEAVAIAQRIAPFFGADTEVESHRAVHGRVIWPPGDRACLRWADRRPPAGGSGRPPCPEGPAHGPA